MSTNNDKPEIPKGYYRVTEVLTPFTDFSAIPAQVLADAADRGSRVHAYCESYALGLFVEDVAEDCKNFVEVYKRWFDENVKDVICTEERLNHPSYRISGSFDMLCVLKGDEINTLVDIKTPALPSLSWQLQTAAYQMLVNDLMPTRASRRISLMLPKQGDSVRVVEYTEHDRDRQLYLNALELYRFFDKSK